jgi:hypothetical protein
MSGLVESSGFVEETSKSKSKKRPRVVQNVSKQEVIVLDSSPSPSSQDEVIFISSSSSSSSDHNRGSSSNAEFDVIDDDDENDDVEVIDDNDVEIEGVVVQSSIGDGNDDMRKKRRSSAHPKAGEGQLERGPKNLDFFGQQRLLERERLIRSRGTYGTSLRVRSAGYEVEFDDEHKVVKKHKFPLSNMDRSVKLKFRSDGEFDHDFIRKIKELEGLPSDPNSQT